MHRKVVLITVGFGRRGTSNEVKITGLDWVIKWHHVIPVWSPRLLCTAHLPTYTCRLPQQLTHSIPCQEIQICLAWREWRANEGQMLPIEYQSNGMSFLWVSAVRGLMLSQVGSRIRQVFFQIFLKRLSTFFLSPPPLHVILWDEVASSQVWKMDVFLNQKSPDDVRYLFTFRPVRYLVTRQARKTNTELKGLVEKQILSSS